MMPLLAEEGLSFDQCLGSGQMSLSQFYISFACFLSHVGHISGQRHGSYPFLFD